MSLEMFGNWMKHSLGYVIQLLKPVIILDEIQNNTSQIFMIIMRSHFHAFFTVVISFALPHDI